MGTIPGTLPPDKMNKRHDEASVPRRTHPKNPYYKDLRPRYIDKIRIIRTVRGIRIPTYYY